MTIVLGMSNDTTTFIKGFLRGVKNKWIIFDHEARNPDYHSSNYQFLKSDVLLGYFYKMGLNKTEEIEEYFTANDYIGDFTQVHFVDIAIDIFVSAINQKKEIVIFSDYDIDGINSALYLSKFLDSVGYLKDFTYHVIINERMYGYGINSFVLGNILDYQNALVFVLDSGTTYCGEIIKMLEHGHDVIVIDHHEPNEFCHIRGITTQYPNFAIINPRVGSDVEYYHASSTAMLVYYFVENVRHKIGRRLKSSLNLDIPALSILSDYMKWTGANIVMIRSLYEMLKSKQSNPIYNRILQGQNLSLDSFHRDLVFSLIPTVDSMGRMDKASESFSLMYSAITDPKMDVESAYRVFDEVNTKRKAIRKQDEAMIESFINKKYGKNRPSFMLINIPNIDRGLLSSLAGGLAGRLGKAVFLLTYKNNKWDGSGRAPKYLNNFLDIIRDLNIPHVMANGHQSAFGVTISKTDENYLKEVENKINQELAKYSGILEAGIDEINGEIKNAKDVRDILDNINIFVPSNFHNRAAYIVQDYDFDGKYIKIDGEKHLCVFENSQVYMNADYHPAIIVRPTIIKDEPAFIITDTIY